tara:strand:+ start:1319 stop:1636 length:318 start_codon:yes stop_codon:yes gene_type:complete
MSLFAYIIDGVVANVIVAEQDFVDNQDGLYIKFEDNDGVLIKDIRVLTGYTYNTILDKFIPFQPYPSWSLNDNHEWESPVPKPIEEGEWDWDEENNRWFDLTTLD